MDVLTTIFTRALEERIVTSYIGISVQQRLSIYAYDVALLIHPFRQDLEFIRCGLQMFGEASGLKVNYIKLMATLIHGDQEDKERILSTL